MTKIYAIATSRNWNPHMAENLEKRTGSRFTLIQKPEDFTRAALDKIRPDKVFIPHWSHIIDESVYSNFNCIIFHMTDLPFGRGGSPLQNLIARGIYQTKISAIKCSKGIDRGPVYLKNNLSLHGNAEEIYIRAGTVIEKMIATIIETDPAPIEQSGEPVNFHRRKPEQGNISSLNSLEQVYDYIRMLDARGYPKAFLETDRFRLEFSRGALKKSCIKADVTISLKQPL